MTYVVSDIHGQYEKFKSILSQISFKSSDVMYVVGDLLDYGEESMELIADLSLRLNVFPIVGEHDYRAARMLKGFSSMLESGKNPTSSFITEMTEWVQDGGQATLDSFRSLDAEQREGVLEYLEDMVLYDEVTVKGKRYVMVHAGIADYTPDTDLDTCHPKTFFTKPLDRTKALMADATVIVGHVPNASGKIERGEGSICLDCGAGEGGSLGCLCLESGEEFYA